jgi:hypothetical protein
MIKKQTVYVPTKVDDDFPRKEVCGISDDDETMLVGYIRNTEFSQTGYEISDDEQSLTSITHWLKPTEGYFFTPEELKQLLSDTFDAGNKSGLAGYSNISYHTQYDKQQYIENLLK